MAKKATARDEDKICKKWASLNNIPILAKPKKYAKIGVHNITLLVDYAARTEENKAESETKTKN